MSNDIEMPLIVGKGDDGGPYDEDSFLAGICLSRLDMILALKPLSISDWVPTALLPQLDLSAMLNGYSIHHVPCEEHDDWSVVVFELNGSITEALNKEDDDHE